MKSREQAGSFVGRVVDRDHLLDFGDTLPTAVDLLDEMLLVVAQDTPLRFDPALGWHLYGVDMCLVALQAGLPVHVLDALGYHNSLTGDGLPQSYRDSEEVLAQKWPDLLPIFAPCSVIEANSAGQRIFELEDLLEETQCKVGELEAKLAETEHSANEKLIAKQLTIQSMEASPFWRARVLCSSFRDRVRRT